MWVWLRVVLAGTLVALAIVPARAEFHIAVIDEFMSGCGADPTIQYVEIRTLLAGQTQVANTRLTAFSCDGSTVNVLRLVASNLTMSGSRWIIASPNFESAAGIVPDSVMTDADPGIFPTCGQICWGAPGASAPNPPTWDFTNPDNYVDCVAYGDYTGARPSGAGALLTDTPNNGSQSLTRVGVSANDNNFALATPSPTNNAGSAGSLGGCGGFSTTSSTSPQGGGTTTSTSLGGGYQTTTTTSGGSTSTTIGSAVSGGGSARTDCFAAWRVAGAAGGTPVVRCNDNDTTCDRDPAPGCLVRAQLCFYDLPGSRCTAAPVTAFALTGQPDGQNATAVAAALQQLPGVQSTVDGVTFSPPLAALTCTGPIDLEVPLKIKGTKAKKGVRTLRSVTTAGKRDKDKLKILCVPAS